ncbi:MAG: heparin lyase I family protein, partial [Coleofasciculaceae cyanobacterium]
MSNSTSDTRLLFADNFEDGISPQWRYETAHEDSVQLVDSPDGLGSAAKFQLSQNDPNVHSSKRSELALGLEPANAERWYGFKTFLPSDWQADPSFEIVTQWHAYPDFDLGEDWRSPPLNLLLRDNKWQIDSRWDPKQVTENNNPEPEGGKETLWQGSYETGKWTDWVFHIDWSYQSDGLIEVWKDNQLVLENQGPNTYNDENGVYFKTGIYKPDWKYNPDKSATSTRTLYIDEVRIADGSADYSTVDPSQPIPKLIPTIQSNTNNPDGNLVSNGSFENNSVLEGEQKFFPSIEGWFTTVGSGVEIKKLTDTFGAAAEGNSWVELDSHSNSGFAQELNTQVGELYELSFD